MRKFFSKPMKWVFTGILIAILLLAISILVAPHLGWRVDVVLGGSMEPTLNVGGAVVVKPVNPEEIRPGEIIVYGSPIDKKLVSHRVIEVKNDGDLYLRTKGDANEDPDAYLVPAQNVIGRVLFHVPKLGFMVNFLKTRLGLILVLFVPALIIIALEMKGIWTTLFKEDTKEAVGVSSI